MEGIPKDLIERLRNFRVLIIGIFIGSETCFADELFNLILNLFVNFSVKSKQIPDNRDIINRQEETNKPYLFKELSLF